MRKAVASIVYLVVLTRFGAPAYHEMMPDDCALTNKLGHPLNREGV